MGGKVDAAQTGVILTGLIYVLVAAGVKVAGTRWIDKLLPAVVIGPMIIVIGLGLAGSAVKNAGFVEGGRLEKCICRCRDLPDRCLHQHQRKRFLQNHSFPFRHYRWLCLRSLLGLGEL